MKRLVLLVALLLFAGVATTQAASTHHHKAGKLHAIKAEGEVVSVDPTAKTATVKVNGEEMTHPVKGKAVAELKKLKAGDKVHLTVMANAANEHQYISSIRPATSSTASAEKKPVPPAKKKY